MITWTESILRDLQISSSDLPPTVSARVVIDGRNLSKTELIAALLEAPDFDSPFTSVYPRYSKQQAIDTLRQLKGRRVVIIDQESTGVKAVSEITEFAAVSLFEENNFGHTFIKPRILASYSGSKAEEISGIKASLLQSAKTLPELWPDMQRIIDAHDVVISHNADFDFRILRSSLQAWGLPAPVIRGTCSMKLITAYYERDYYVSLENACLLAGVDQASFGKAHGALADARVTKAVLVTLMNEVYKE